MAKGNIKGITIEIGGDTTGLDKALSGVNKEANALQRELREVEKSLKFNPGNMELLGQKAKVLTGEIDAVSTKLQTLRDAQQQVEEQFARGEIGEEQYRAFQRELINTENKLGSLQGELGKTNGLLANGGKEVKSYAERLEDAGKSLEATGKKINDVGEKASKIGEGLTKGVTAPILAIGAASIAAFADLDNMLDTITTSTGAAGKELESLQDSARNIASTTIFEFDNIGRAVGEVKKQFGSMGAELEGQTDILLKFAEITESDVVTSTQNAKKAMDAYKLSTSDLPMILDTVASTAQNTGANIDKLFQAAVDGSYQIREMGLSFGEGVALMGQFEKAGIESTKALGYMSKAAVNYAKDGKTLEDGLNATINSIKNASSETEALTAAAEVFGTRGAVTMVEAIKRGTFSLDELKAAAKNAGGTVETTFDNILDPIDRSKVALNNAKLALADVGDVIQQEAGPALDELTKILKDAGKWVQSLDDDTKRNIVRWAAMAAAIGPVVVVLGKVTSGVGSFVKYGGQAVQMVAGMVTKFSAMGASGAAAAAGTTAAATATAATGTAATAATPGVAGFGATLTAAVAPIALVAAGLGVLVIAVNAISDATDENLKKHKEWIAQNDKLQSSNKELTDSLARSAEDRKKSAASMEDESKIADDLVKSITQLSQKTNKTTEDKAKLKTMINQLNSIMPGLNLAYNEQADALNMSAKSMEEYVKNQRAMIEQRAAEESMLDIAKQRLELERQMTETSNALADAETRLADAYNNTTLSGSQLKAMQYGLRQEVEQLKEQSGIQLAQYSALGTEMDNLSAKTIESTIALDANNVALQGSAQSSFDASTAAHGAAEAQSMLGETASLSAEEVDAAMKKMDEAYDRHAATAQNAFTKIKDDTTVTVGEMISNLESNQKRLEEWTANMALLAERGLDEGFLEQLRKLGPEGAKTVENLANASEEKFNKVNEVYKNGAHEAVEATVTEFSTPEAMGVTEMWLEEQIKSIEQKTPEATAATEEMVRQSVDAIKQKVDEFRNAGRDTAQGAINGVLEKKSAAYSAGAELARAFNEGYKKTLDQHSPSRLMRKGGRDTAQGAILGLLDRIPDARSAANRFANELFAATNGEFGGSDTTSGIEVPQATTPVTLQFYLDGAVFLDESMIAKFANMLTPKISQALAQQTATRTRFSSSMVGG